MKTVIVTLASTILLNSCTLHKFNVDACPKWANNIKNPDGLNMGALLGPSIQAAFMKDLAPVRDKGFIKGLEMPKVKMLTPDDIQEEELEEKETVFKPVTEGKKYKYTKRK